MQYLEIADVEQIIHLVARAGDATVEMSLADRKRMIMEGMAEMVDADVWGWSNGMINPAIDGDFMTTSLIDGGYKDERERAGFYISVNDPGMRKLFRKVNDAVRDEQYLTFVRQELISEDEWQHCNAPYSTLGFAHMLLSIYPLGNGIASGIGFHRRAHKPPFTERDRAIVHVVFQQVDWLHRDGTNVPAAKTALQLAPRERQVLMLLLVGDSIKEVASKLAISENTVNNYVKAIYKSFNVNSRAELLAFFMTGGQSKAN